MAGRERVRDRERRERGGFTQPGDRADRASDPSDPPSPGPPDPDHPRAGPGRYRSAFKTKRAEEQESGPPLRLSTAPDKTGLRGSPSGQNRVVPTAFRGEQRQGSENSYSGSVPAGISSGRVPAGFHSDPHTPLSNGGRRDSSLAAADWLAKALRC